MSRIDFTSLKECGEVWEEMESCGSSRQCKRCKEMIHDFRGMTEWEIAIRHAESEGKLCGVYDRNFNETRSFFFRKWIRKKLSTSVLGLSILGGSAYGQEVMIHKEKVEYSVGKVVNKKSINQVDSTSQEKQQQLIVRGILREKETGEVLIGGAIYLETDTNVGSTTDFDGRFSINVTDSFQTEDTLTFYAFALGMERDTFFITKNDIKENGFIELDISLIESDMSLQSFVVRKKRPWYIRLWRWVFHPFR